MELTFAQIRQITGIARQFRLNMIDINYHIITELDNPPPRDYFESFIELGKLKILPHKFATIIA